MKALATMMALSVLALTVPAGHVLAAGSDREAPLIQPSAVPTAETEYGRGIANRGYDVRSVSTSADALQVAGETPPDVVLLDYRLPDGSGLDVLAALIAADPERQVIMMTAYGSVSDAVQAI